MLFRSENVVCTTYPSAYGQTFILRVENRGGGTHRPCLYTVAETGALMLLAIGDEVTWVPARAGVYVNGTNPAQVDWFEA